VQDGGSTDESLDVLRQFERRLTSWTSEPDQGQGDAVNRGFERTGGEIMGWLNSDDLLLPGALAAVAQYFVKHPDVDVLYGNRIMIDENDGQIGAWILPDHDDRALTLADYVPQETLFWRRRTWEAVGGSLDTNLRFAVDWDLLLRFRAAGARIAHLPRFLGAFRVHSQQKTLVDRKIGRSECAELRRRVHGRSVSEEEVFAGLRRYFAGHVRAHNRQRFVDRLPLPRMLVETTPMEPSLRRSVPLELVKGDPAPLVSPLAPPAELPPELIDPAGNPLAVAATRGTMGG
jgi:glycosyltransferase involved in cell wall biosynthesis